MIEFYVAVIKDLFKENFVLMMLQEKQRTQAHCALQKDKLNQCYNHN